MRSPAFVRVETTWNKVPTGKERASGFWKNGRGGEIRTHDLLYPKQARYQATLRPDEEGEDADATSQLQTPFSNDVLSKDAA